MVDSAGQRVRFAVIGLGNIAQVAVLPAFEHAQEECELVALISSDEAKRKTLALEYAVPYSGTYDDLERILDEAEVDAAYIALPNTQHREMTERCARAGVHVLCEKPMATSVSEGQAMIEACNSAQVQLMIAYRLHFEPANLRAVEIAQSGRLGELRYFSSTFGQEVREGDIRTSAKLGGGALFDMGIYCVNAARYLFREEPELVLATSAAGHDERFQGVDEMTMAVLRFPGDRFAQLVASQGSANVDGYRIAGTKGDLQVEPAYTYRGERRHVLRVDGKTSEETFEDADQFAPQLLYFARCIRTGDRVEPSGEEGIADVRVLEAIRESARTGRAVELAPFRRDQYPGIAQEIRRPPVRNPPTVHAPSPTT